MAIVLVQLIIGGKDFGRFMLITVIILLAVILPDIVVMLSTGAQRATL
ncbi:MAG: hypothetical protein K5900_05360 [Butyrivibrio sp.]|nr:hypothetical protein [Butyrivibrio sp.]